MGKTISYSRAKKALPQVTLHSLEAQAEFINKGG
jgi:hypothetical protein